MDLHELVISLERLTRFEYPLKKKNRVYREILFKNLIHPKISLRTYYNYPLSTINAIVKLIWDTSLKRLGIDQPPSFTINAYLAYEEIKIFSVNSMITDLLLSESVSKFTRISSIDNIDQNINQIITNLNESGFSITENNEFDNLSSIYYQYKLNFPLDISGLLDLIAYNNDVSVNLKRLIWINNKLKKEKIQDLKYNETLMESLYSKVEDYREKEGSRFPAKLILLVEGITEEKLLPVFADKIGINFDKKGIILIAAGGKNQSARLYKRFKKETNLPILILLDADAASIADEINEELRINDQIFILKNGEFEDILTVDLICRALNTFYRLIGEVSSCDIKEDQSRVSQLENLWKEKGFGEFNKAEFAKIIAENIRDKNDISDTLSQIFLSISGML